MAAPIRLGDVTVDPPVLLAPMAGITDAPFRDLVLSFGAGLVVSEMVASQEMVQAKPGVRERAELGLGAARTSVQIAGREARWMAEAARRLEGQGARVIDINMGCPAKKVANGGSGSALMRDPNHALSLIEAVAGAVSVPVTLKMRLGWDDTQLNAPAIAARAEAAGIRMITVHGRTRCQFYKGRAHWAAVAEVVRAVRVPVIVNGDIASPDDARRALALSGAAGVMIGRATRGRPWLPSQIAAALSGRTVPPAPIGQALSDMIAAHYEAMLTFYGASLGSRVARKHLGWYLADRPDLRRLAVTAETPGDVLSLLGRGALAA